jgi:hypothetical protein
MKGDVPWSWLSQEKSESVLGGGVAQVEVVQVTLLPVYSDSCGLILSEKTAYSADVLCELAA